MAGSAARTDHGRRLDAGSMRLELLGGFRMEGDDRVVTLPPGGQRLVALLAVRGPLSRAVAGRLLWPDVDEARAHARMRTTLWRIGSDDLGLDTTGRQLALPPGTTVDVRTRIEVMDRLIGHRRSEPTDLEMLVGAPGDLLPGWYDDWVLLDREWLRRLHQEALEALAGIESDRGRHAVAVDAALAAVRLEPLRETAHHALIRAHLGERNLGEAARHYRTLVALLEAELGVAPARSLTSLLAAHGLAG